MASERSSVRWVRWVAVFAVAGGVGLVGEGVGEGATLPQPLASVTSALTSQQSPLTALPRPALPLSPAPAPAPAPAPVPAPVPAPQLPVTRPGAAPAAPLTQLAAPGAAPLSARALPGAPAAQRPAGTAASGSARTQAGSAPAGVVASTPVASVCLVPTGSASPAVELDLKAAGADLSSPLVQHFPQVFAPCPTNAVPASDTVAAVDASVTGLLGACVRVTRQVAPVQTTIVVLDHNLIQELEAAGVPLDQLIVPCPAGAGAGTGATGGSGVATAAQQAGTAAENALTQATLNDGRLAFTGLNALPLGVLAIVLLWVGSLVVRFARRLGPAPRS